MMEYRERGDGVKGWHFLPYDRRTANGHGVAISAGVIVALKPYERRIQLCEWGFHSSRLALDAVGYAPGSIVERVRSWGAVQQGYDKLVAEVRECLWIADAEQALHEYGFWVVARFAQELARMPYSRAYADYEEQVRAVTEAKRALLKGEIDHNEYFRVRDRNSALAIERSDDPARKALYYMGSLQAPVAARAGRIAVGLLRYDEVNEELTNRLEALKGS
jgi:hypothetical protein